MKNLSIYIHIPFCVQKCNYCDFLSAPATEATRQAYVERLIEEIETEAEHYRNDTVVSVFFGGGTPTVLQTEQLCAILTTLKEQYHVSHDAEITMEVNPKTADYQKLAACKKAGVNRLSIGMQSARDEELKRLGRIHTFEDFLALYDEARQAGFQNINVDVMSALPGQTMEKYEETLHKVLALQPEHISAYSLIVEEGTPFFEWNEKGLLALPEEEVERQMYKRTEKRLAEHGYRRYEISNYAKEGYECRHNSVYWRRGNYVGFGIGAASMVDNVRFQNDADLTKYIAGNREKQVDKLSKKECMEEFMFLGLRMMEGVKEAQFVADFGITMEEVYGPVLQKMQVDGLLERTDGAIRLTKRGIDVSNYVMAAFLLDE